MSEARMPESVVIGPYMFQVARSQPLMDRKRVENDSVFRIGNVDRWANEILVAPEVCEAVARVTLAHEVLHGCYMAMGAAGATLSEEEVCERLTPVLVDTLRRNPELVRYLTG